MNVDLDSCGLIFACAWCVQEDTSSMRTVTRMYDCLPDVETVTARKHTCELIPYVDAKGQKIVVSLLVISAR
jgi:hypothetical protein